MALGAMLLHTSFSAAPVLVCRSSIRWLTLHQEKGDLWSFQTATGWHWASHFASLCALVPTARSYLLEFNQFFCIKLFALKHADSGWQKMSCIAYRFQQISLLKKCKTDSENVNVLHYNVFEVKHSDVLLLSDATFLNDMYFTKLRKLKKILIFDETVRVNKMLSLGQKELFKNNILEQQITLQSALISKSRKWYIRASQYYYFLELASIVKNSTHYCPVSCLLDYAPLKPPMLSTAMIV